MFRIYNHRHEGVGKPVRAKDALVFNIPPIGEYVEISHPEEAKERSFRLACDTLVRNSLGKLSFEEPTEKSTVITPVVDILREENLRLQAEREELLAKLAELEAKEPEVKTKRVLKDKE